MSNARRLLLDTNILLDYIVPDRPHSSAAATLVHMAGAESLTIFATPQLTERHVLHCTQIHR